MNHPNLSEEINKNIAQSEKDGGWWLKDIPTDTMVLVRTYSRMYRIYKRVGEDGKEFFTIEGHPKYCPKPTYCNIAGSTWGGSMLKMGFIGKGMRLEFNTVLHPLPITTSSIQEITVAFQ
jgi:hypothetical protein